MNKTILFGAVITAVLVTGIVSSEFVEGAPKNQGTSTPKTLDLQPVAGRTIIIDVLNSGTSFLYYGTELCQFDARESTQLNTYYIEFATETTVLDQGACGQPSIAINLVGSQDAVFQKGDFLILQGVTEVYRQQTP